VWKVTIKGLLAHKIRFVMTGFAVILGVAFVSGTFVLTDTIRQTLDNLFSTVYQHTDAVVREQAVFAGAQGDTQRPRLDESLLRNVQAVGGVRSAAGEVTSHRRENPPRFVQNPPGQRRGGFGGGRGVTATSWIEDPLLNPYRVVSGRAPRSDREIVMDQHSADVRHYKLGAGIPMFTHQGRETFRLVGTIKFGTQQSFPGRSIVAFTPAKAQQAVGEPGKVDAILVRATPGTSQATLVARIESAVATPRSKIEVLTGQEAINELQNNLQNRFSFFTIALLVFAGIGLVVGMFVIFNTFSILLAQRTRELALLRAIGAKESGVLGAVMGEALITGLFASGVGLGLGVFLAQGLKALLDAFGLRLPSGPVVFEVRTVIVSVLVGTGVTLLAAVVPALKASRTPPIAAMQDVAIDRSAASRSRLVGAIVLLTLGLVLSISGLVRSQLSAVGFGAMATFVGVVVVGPVIARPLARLIGAPLSRLRGTPGTLATKNAMRNPRRTAGTAAALMIGVGLVGFVMVLASSAKASETALVQRVVRADLIVTPDRQAPFPPTVATNIAKLPGVTAASGHPRMTFEVSGAGAVDVSAFDPHVLLQLVGIDVARGGLEHLDANGLAVQQDTAKSKHFTIGTQVRVRAANGASAVLTVQAIYKESTPAGSYLMSNTVFSRLYPVAIGGEAYVKLAPGADAAFRREVQPLLGDYSGAQIQTRSEFAASETQRLDTVLGLVYVLLALSIVIALFGIYNTLGLSIYERTRELGLLRAVGMTRSQIRSSVRWESVIVAVLGTGLGLAVGLSFAWVIVLSSTSQGLDQLSLPFVQLMVIVFLAAACGLAAALLPAWRAGRLDVLDAIATE